MKARTCIAIILGLLILMILGSISAIWRLGFNGFILICCLTSLMTIAIRLFAVVTGVMNLKHLGMTTFLSLLIVGVTGWRFYSWPWLVISIGFVLFWTIRLIIWSIKTQPKSPAGT